MPVLPDDGSRIVSPALQLAGLLGQLDHLERDAVLRRAAGVLAFELGEDPDVGIGRQRVHPHERGVADDPEDVLVAHVAAEPERPTRAAGQPPATAGRIEMTSPSDTLVSSCSR